MAAHESRHISRVGNRLTRVLLSQQTLCVRFAARAGLGIAAQRDRAENALDPRVRYFTGREAVLYRINTWWAEKNSGGKAVVVPADLEPESPRFLPV